MNVDLSQDGWIVLYTMIILPVICGNFGDMDELTSSSHFLAGPMNGADSGQLSTAVRGVVVIDSRMVLTRTCAAPWMLRWCRR